MNIQADDELLDWVRNNAETTYHPVGTCKMGVGPDGGGRRPASGARHGGAARRRCLDHADADLGQHQCAVDHDWPLADIATDEIAPGVNISADDELLDWVRNNAETTYHPVGTCKMGADAMAVVDDQLRVRGLAGLRVADASIMPTLTSGNTNAPSIMIGEKAARMMLASTVQAVAA